MSLWDPFNGASPDTHPQPSSRLLPMSLFSRLEVLLDTMGDRHDAQISDLLGRRMGNLTISRILVANEDEENKETIDTDTIFARCATETYVSKQMPESNLMQSQQEECPICLEQFKFNDKLLRLPCNHRFHIDCVVPWIRRNHDKCPFCRAKIVAMVKKNQNYMTSSSNNATLIPQNHVNTNTNTQNSDRDLYGASHNIPMSNYGTHRGTSHNTPIENYGTPRNTPIYSNNAHINRDVPMGIRNVPHQTNHSHPARIASGIPQSLPSGTNHHTRPTINNFGPAIRDIPIHFERQPQFSKPQNGERIIAHQGPPTSGTTNLHHGQPSRELMNSTPRPPNYPGNVLSRSGYTRRHDGNILVDFGEEETPIATLTRLSFWI